MSPDLRSMLREAAPQPLGGVDERKIARRARRITGVRVLAAVAAVTFAVAGGAVVARSTGDSGPVDVADDVLDRTAPRFEVPRGRRHVVVSGVYGADWHERWRGKAWRLLVWAKGETRCFQLAEEDAARNENTTCSDVLNPKSIDSAIFGPSTSFRTESEDPDQFLFVMGEVGPRVDRLEFRPDDGAPVDVPLHDAPEKTGIPYRYYAVTLPRYDLGYLTAYGDGGGGLETHRLCGPGCEEEREAERDAEVAAYEAEPVTLEAKAAVFAVAAAGQAGLVDHFGTLWSYRRIVRLGNGFVAMFVATECSSPTPEGGVTCGRRRERTSVRFRIEDERFSVAGATGPMTAAQRARLLAYSEEVPADLRGWQVVSYAFAPGRGRSWYAGYAAVWTGNVPPPAGDYGSVCLVTAVDERGRSLAERRSPFEVDSRESLRVTAGITELEAAEEPAALELACDRPALGVSERWR